MMNAPSPARLFLARALAWPQDGEALAYANIHYTFLPPDTSRLKKRADGTWENLPWSGTASRDLAGAAKAIDFIKSRDTNRDIYYCTSTQAYAEEKTSGKGFKWFKAVRSAENAVMHRSLFIDIDLTDGKKDKTKGYETSKELFQALGVLLVGTGLPKPTMIVATGGGFHVYWTLMQPLQTKDWLPLAYALAEATRRHNLKCDAGCTIDPARVLRVPGTLNYKYEPPRDVTLLGNMVEYDYANAKIEEALAPYKVAIPHSVANGNMSILPPKAPLQGMSELASGIDMSSTAPVKLDSLVHECGFVAEALATGGSAFNNPLWNLTTLIATFTEGGRADAHRMASGHSSYGPGEQDELFDRKVDEKLVKNMGWPRCAAIAQSGCASCATCPHFPENKSPLNFGQKVGAVIRTLTSTITGATPTPTQPSTSAALPSGGTPVAPQPQTPALPPLVVPGTGVQDPDLPRGYLRNADGLILYAQAQDDGTSTWLPVSFYPMTEPWMQREPWSLNFTTETEFGKTSQVCVPLKDVGTAEMKKHLQEQGFMVTGGARGFNIVSDFIMSWITKLQSTKDSIVTSVPFGWLVRGGKTHGFVYGGRLHTPTGNEVASNTDFELARQFCPTGDRQPWIDAAKMVTDQKRPALDAIIAAAFGAPLVRFTGHQGLLMSAYSIESGIGKSTAIKIAQSVWGDPIKGVQSLSDTQNSVLNKLGELRSLPIFWDELKSADDTKKFVDTVFRLSLGKEKSRMTSKVTQRTPGTWQTILVSASNDSLFDAVQGGTKATTAGLYRVFEYTVTPPMRNGVGQIDPTVAQRTVARLHDNYGNIGEEYAAYLGGNHALVEKDMEALMSQIGAEVSMTADERFWIALMSCVILGARYSNQLGFTDIDENRLKAFLYITLRDMRKERNSQPVDMRNSANIANVMGRFLNEARSRYTLQTNIIHRGRGKPAAGSVTYSGDTTRLEAIHVHIGVDDRVLRVSQSYLGDWLADNGYPRHVVMRALQDEMKATTISARLGAGTPFATPSVYLLEIDLKGNPLMNFLDEQ